MKHILTIIGLLVGIFSYAQNVGIGTASPLSKLDILPAGGQDALIGGGSSTGSEIKLTNGGSSGTHFSIYNAGSSKLTIANTSSSVSTNTSGTSLMTILSTGYVGIGETSPANLLVVKGSLSVGSGYSTTAAPTNGALIQGNVGIGLTSAPEALTVAGDGSGKIFIGGSFEGGNYAGISMNGLTGNSYNILSSTSDQNLYLNRPTGYGLYFRENNSNQMILNPVSGILTVNSLAGTGYRPVVADASGNLYTISGSSANRKLFAYTGGSQSWVVPAGVNIIFVKLWGAGGASAYSTGDGPGGAGGFVSGFLNVTPGSTLTVIVGEGGIGGTNSGNSSGTASTSGTIYGGGGLAGHGYSGTGGGRSAIQISSGTDAVTAGAGGGGSRNNIRWGSGGGGGLIGAAGALGQIYNGGSGGTQAGGGTEIWNGTSSQNSCSNEPGLQYQGGRGCTGNDGSGGGGGGFWGGGGGGGGGDGPAGGGSSYISGLIPYLPIRNEQGATVNNYNAGYTVVQSFLIQPGGTDAPDYTNGVGVGGTTVTSGTTGNNGGNGQVVIYW